MFARTSPQPLAVGEAVQMITNPVSNERLKQSYAASLQTNQSTLSKIELCPVMYDHGEPIIQCTMEEVNNFTKEEGLHQAIIIKFSYGRPDLVTVRKMFSSHFDVHGQYNIWQLEFRHLLIRFDLYDDYVRFLSKSTGYLKSKGEEFLFRTFPWTFGFNPREETSMAVVWISLPGLPPNLFAKRSLMSIAAAVGKPLAVDKSTQDRTRPSTTRVKVIVDLLKKHPKKVTLQILDSVSGKTVELHQLIVFDNLPKYCVFCKHQGHDLTACRIRKQKTGIEERIEEDLDNNQSRNDANKIDKLKGDGRDFLNNKIAEQRAKDLQERKDNTGDKSTEGEQHMSGVLNSQQTADLNVKVGQCSSVVQHGNVEKQNDVSQSSQISGMDMLNATRQLSCKMPVLTEKAEISHLAPSYEFRKERQTLDNHKSIFLTRPYVVPAEIKRSSAVYNIKDTHNEQVIEMDGQISKGSKQQQKMSATTSVENVPITEDVCNTAGIMQTTSHLKMQCMADNDNMIPNLDNVGSMQTNVNQRSQSAHDGQCIGIVAHQHKAVNAVNGQSNMQHLGLVNEITGSNLNPTDFIEQQQTKQMVIHENAILLNQAVGNNLETMAKDHTVVALQQRENSSVAAISDSSKVTGIHPHSRDSSVNQNNEATTQITTSFPEDDIEQNTNSEDIICRPECSKQNSHIAEESTTLISSSNSFGKGNGGTGGKLYVIKSFSLIPYTYVESKDHEEFSISVERTIHYLYLT